jgi:Ca2+-binding RTX toxin-like protein
MEGGAGDDTLLGGDGGDTISPGAGVDHIDGGAAPDFLSIDRSGLTGAFSLTTGGFASGLTLPDGTSIVNVERFDIRTGSGDDTLEVTTAPIGENSFNGGAGVDRFVADLSGVGGAVNLSWPGGYILLTNVEELHVQLGAGDDGVTGGSGDDVISGNGGHDDLSGSLGDDTISGGDGDDAIGGDSLQDDGNDVLLGGAGFDELFGGADGVDVIDGGPGHDVLHMFRGYATTGQTLSLAGMQTSEGATLADGTIIRNTESFQVTTGNYDDTLEVAGGDAFVGSEIGFSRWIAQGGSDRLVADFSAATLAIEMNNFGSSASFRSRFFFLDADSVEQYIVTGGSGNDSLEGGIGDDVLAGGAGDDGLWGDVDGGAGADVLQGGAGTDFLNGGDGDDVLDGGAELDELRGGLGDDTLRGGDGDDVLDGGDRGVVADGAGSDLASYRNAAGAVIVSLAIQDVAQDTGAAGLDRLVSIERLEGSGFGDLLTGSSSGDTLAGLGGDDVLDGGAGADSMSGGAGDDRFVLTVAADGVDQIFGGVQGADAGFDVVDYSAATAGVIVQLSGWSTTSAGAQLTTFSGIEAAVGTSFSDALIGDVGNNRITGGAGADWLVGGGGDDWFVQGIEGGAPDRLFGDAGIDTLDYGAASAGIVVQLSGYSTVNGGATLATFSGIENAIGSAFADVLVGNAADNVITGGAGADWLVGGAGDDAFAQGIDTSSIDRLFGDAGTDTIDYGAASAGVTVQLSGYSTSGGVTLATFNGIESAIGTAFSDVLVGNASDNRITGGAGADWLVGGAGNDTFVQTIQAGVDTIFGDAGFDTIDYSGAAAGVTVQLSGYSASGGATLATFAGIEAAIGTSSSDALIGNASSNTLTGGAGADWLVGGIGADTFAYRNLADGAGDSIRDFSQAENDKIDLSAIDANSATGADDPFAFSATRTNGAIGEVVVTNAGTFSLVSLYLDADSIADMTIQVVHGQGVVMTGSDFVL